MFRWQETGHSRATVRWEMTGHRGGGDWSLGGDWLLGGDWSFNGD